MIGQASGRVTRAVIANARMSRLFQKLLYTDPDAAQGKPVYARLPRSGERRT